MESDALEASTSRLRNHLQFRVPDLLLQAECGGGLELPTPLPWGFASVPTLYELAGIAERELHDMKLQSDCAQHDRRCRDQPACTSQHEPHSAGQEPSGPPPDQHVVHGNERWQLQQPTNQQGGAGSSPTLGQQEQREDAQWVESDTRACSGPLWNAPRRPSPQQYDAAGVAGDGGGRDTSPCRGGPERDRVQVRGNGSEAAPEGVEQAAQVQGEQGSAGATPGAAAAGHPAERASGGSCAAGAARDGNQASGVGGGGDRSPPARGAEQVATRPTQPAYACTAFLDSLEQSRTFRSPHCEGAMVEAMGMTELYDGLAGSSLGPPPGKDDLEALRSLLKDHVNARWALEAVKQGVAAAKQGNYVDAHKCYARALELDPHGPEAYVARGAAHANQRAFADAERDLRHALVLDPDHRNATAYLEAVLRRVEEQRQELEALEEERQRTMARQQQQHQLHGRRRQSAAEGGGEDGPGGGRRPAVTPGAAPARQVAGQGAQGPPSAPGRLQQAQYSGVEPQGLGASGQGGAARRRRKGGSSGSSDGTASSSDGGGSSGGTPGQGAAAAAQRPASDDIKRALEVVLKARKEKHRSKQKREKKKSKKSKRRKHD